MNPVYPVVAKKRKKKPVYRVRLQVLNAADLCCMLDDYDYEIVYSVLQRLPGDSHVRSQITRFLEARLKASNGLALSQQ